SLLPHGPHAPIADAHSLEPAVAIQQPMIEHRDLGAGAVVVRSIDPHDGRHMSLIGWCERGALPELAFIAGATACCANIPGPTTSRLPAWPGQMLARSRRRGSSGRQYVCPYGSDPRLGARVVCREAR